MATKRGDLTDRRKVQIGDKCPSFSLPDQNGNTVNVGDFIGKKILVIYFYPADDSAVCTAEACSFRDSYEDFESLGAEVIGISGDSIESHEKFAAKHRLNFTLLADTDKQVRKLFGVRRGPFGLWEGRTTYIIDRAGIVRGMYSGILQSDQHIEAAKKTIQELS